MAGTFGFDYGLIPTPVMNRALKAAMEAARANQGGRAKGPPGYSPAAAQQGRRGPDTTVEGRFGSSDSLPQIDPALAKLAADPGVAIRTGGQKSLAAEAAAMKGSTRPAMAPDIASWANVDADVDQDGRPRPMARASVEAAVGGVGGIRDGIATGKTAASDTPEMAEFAKNAAMTDNQKASAVSRGESENAFSRLLAKRMGIIEKARAESADLSEEYRLIDEKGPNLWTRITKTPWDDKNKRRMDSIGKTLVSIDARKNEELDALDKTIANTKPSLLTTSQGGFMVEPDPLGGDPTAKPVGPRISKLSGIQRGTGATSGRQAFTAIRNGEEIVSFYAGKNGQIDESEPVNEDVIPDGQAPRVQTVFDDAGKGRGIRLKEGEETPAGFGKTKPPPRAPVDPNARAGERAAALTEKHRAELVRRQDAAKARASVRWATPGTPTRAEAAALARELEAIAAQYKQEADAPTTSGPPSPGAGKKAGKLSKSGATIEYE